MPTERAGDDTDEWLKLPPPRLIEPAKADVAMTREMMKAVGLFMRAFLVEKLRVKAVSSGEMKSPRGGRLDSWVNYLSVDMVLLL